MENAFNFMTLFLVASGGACGALARYCCGVVALELLGPSFPYGTLFVNALGSAFMGGIGTFFLHKHTLAHPVALFLMVGFFGSFTTYSSFTLDTLNLFLSSQTHLALLNILLNVVLCISFVTIGMFVTNYFL